MQKVKNAHDDEMHIFFWYVTDWGWFMLSLSQWKQAWPAFSRTKRLQGNIDFLPLKAWALGWNGSTGLKSQPFRCGGRGSEVQGHHQPQRNNTRHPGKIKMKSFTWTSSGLQLKEVGLKLPSHCARLAPLATWPAFDLHAKPTPALPPHHHCHGFPRCYSNHFHKQAHSQLSHPTGQHQLWPKESQKEKPNLWKENMMRTRQQEKHQDTWM